MFGFSCLVLGTWQGSFMYAPYLDLLLLLSYCSQNIWHWTSEVSFIGFEETEASHDFSSVEVQLVWSTLLSLFGPVH